MSQDSNAPKLDKPTRDLIESLAGAGTRPAFNNVQHDTVRRDAYAFYNKAELAAKQTRPDEPGQARRIKQFFLNLVEIKKDHGFFADQLGFPKDELARLALMHQKVDEHGVTIGARVFKAVPYVEQSKVRVSDYVHKREIEAPSGIVLWPKMMENRRRIQQVLRMNDADWNSFSGQYKNQIDSLLTLSQIVKLPEEALVDLMRVTQKFRLRILPYFASLIMEGNLNDPILLQCLPMAQCLENQGQRLPTATAQHSPARLVDQLYPRVVAIKATNICPVHCVHCLRRPYIGEKDRVFSVQALNDALDYVRKNENIRDVLITGGDALMLPNKVLNFILGELDKIGHVKTKRLGTRVPVAAPHRVGNTVQEILGRSNDKKPLRLMTHINCAQEITPVAVEVLKKLSRRTSAILNQTVLLKGINDTVPKLWHLCEMLQEAYVKPHYLYNCDHRDPWFAHMRVPVSVGQDLVESMHGCLPGDAIPRYVALAGGKIPLEKGFTNPGNSGVWLTRPWTGEEFEYADADRNLYNKPS